MLLFLFPLLSTVTCSTVSPQRVLPPLPVLRERAGVRVISIRERPSTSQIPSSSASAVRSCAVARQFFDPCTVRAGVTRCPPMGSAAAPRTAQPTRARDSRRQFSPSGPSPPPDQIAFGPPFTVHYPLSTIHYSPSVLYHKISPGKKCYSLDLKDCANRCQKPPFRTQKGGFRVHRRRCPSSKWRYSPNSAVSRGTLWHHLAPSGTFSSQKASPASRPNLSKPCFNQHYHFDHCPRSMAPRCRTPVPRNCSTNGRSTARATGRPW